MTARRRGAALPVVLAPAVVAVLLAGALTGAAGSGDSPRTFAGDRHGFKGSLPPGWHRSAQRLVPLLSPREIVSLGTFGMRPGGGGNCGREPVAALARMERGDALVTIQEVNVFPKLRARLARSYPPRPDRFHLRVAPFPPHRWKRGHAAEVRHGKLVFSDRGRAFEALLYVSGPLTPGLRADLAQILDGIRFRPAG